MKSFLYDISIETLIKLVNESKSWNEILRKVGLKSGANKNTLIKVLCKYEINYDHIDGRYGIKNNRTYTNNEIFIDNSPVCQHTVRERVIKEKLIEQKCENCKKDIENDGMTLELDHINGNPQDNTLSNLILLCPNCHAFTPTHRGKNKKLKNTKT